MNKKDMTVLGHFRNNARTSLTKMSRKTKIPVSTIFDKLKVYEKDGLINKYCTLLDFKALGYNIRVSLLVKLANESKDSFQKFILKHPKVNNIYRVNSGYDYLLEAVFKDLDDFDEFNKEIDKYGVTAKKELFIMEDLKREEFLSHRENIGLVR